MPGRLVQRSAGREIALGAVAIGTLVAIGTAGYVLLEGWSVMDAFYMTFITLTTIGFSEVQPLDPAGKLFTVGLAAVGIGTFATFATRTVQLLVTNPGFRERLMQRRIDGLSGHYVIAGYGRLGQRIARDLTAGGRSVVVVDHREDRAQQLDDAGLPYVQDEAEEEATLRRAGLERAAGLVLVLPVDAANVFVALTAREVAGPDLFIVARTNMQTSINKLHRAGVDKVISPLEIGADRIAQTILRPRVDRFMEQVLGVEALDFDLEEIVVEENGVLDGRSLREVDFRQRYDAVVVAILTGADGTWRFNPDATVPLRAGDTLIVMASPKGMQAMRDGERALARGRFLR